MFAFYSAILAIVGIHFMSSTLPLAGLASLGFLLVILSLIFTRQRLKPSVFGPAFLAIILAGLFALVDAYLPGQAFSDVLSTTLLVLSFYLLYTALSGQKQALVELQKVCFAGLFLFLLVGLIQYLKAHGYLPTNFLYFLAEEANWSDRVRSLFISRSGVNVYAAYLALACPIYAQWLFGRWPKLDNIQKALHGLVFILLVFNIMTTESRALIISLFTVFVLVISRSKYFWKALLMGVLVLFVAILVITPVRDTFWSFINTKDTSNSDHYHSLVLSLQQVVAHPINGWGGGHINTKLKQVDGQWIDLRGKYSLANEKELKGDVLAVHNAYLKEGIINVDSPHNMYLNFATEYGLIGLGAFLWLLYLVWHTLQKIIQKSKRHKDFAYALQLGLFSFCVYGFFQDSIRSSIMAGLFWCYLIMVQLLKDESNG